MWTIDPNLLKGIKSTFDIKLEAMPNESNCIAAPMCKYIGNLRPSCLKGNTKVLDIREQQKCIQSAVFILGSIAGLFVEKPLPSKPIQGFSHQSPDIEDEGK